MYTLTIANQKGGIGKTTSAAAISQGLTAAGYRVLCVDADPQKNLTNLLQAEPGPSVIDVIQGMPVKEAIQQTPISGALLPSEKALASPRLKITPSTFQQILMPLQRSYDIAIIDTMPALGPLTVSALMASDGLLVPVKADRFSLSGLQELYASVMAIKPQLKIVGIVVTQFNGRASLHQDVLDALKEQARIYNTCVLLPPVSATISAERWQYSGNIYKPKSTASKDYQEIVNQLIKILKLKKRSK